MHSLEKMKVLVVEDNPNDVTIIKRAMRKSDVKCELYFARDGEEALDALAAEGGVRGYATSRPNPARYQPAQDQRARSPQEDQGGGQAQADSGDRAHDLRARRGHGEGVRQRSRKLHDKACRLEGFRAPDPDGPGLLANRADRTRVVFARFAGVPALRACASAGVRFAGVRFANVRRHLSVRHRATVRPAKHGCAQPSCAVPRARAGIPSTLSSLSTRSQEAKRSVYTEVDRGIC